MKERKRDGGMEGGRKEGKEKERREERKTDLNEFQKFLYLNSFSRFQNYSF